MKSKPRKRAHSGGANKRIVRAKLPKKYRKHLASSACWCNPRLDYEDPVTGNAVFVHHREH